MATDVIAAFKALSVDEQRHVLSELAEHVESLEPTDITSEQAAILDRRVKSIREHPERLIPWEQVNARAKETIKNARK